MCAYDEDAPRLPPPPEEWDRLRRDLDEALEALKGLVKAEDDFTGGVSYVIDDPITDAVRVARAVLSKHSK